MITGNSGEYYDDGVIGGYFGSDGHLIVCYEYGTDEYFDSHSVDVQNGNGYYNDSGKYVSYERE